MLLLNRPVAALVLVLATFLFGTLALRELSVDLLPRIDAPTLLVQTDWPGTSPREVEHRLNEPLEALVRTVPGVADIHSLARPGQGILSVSFAWGTDMDLAFLNTREKLERARPMLPEQAGRPQLLAANPSDEPVMVLGVTDPGGDAFALKRWTEQVLARRLEQLDGVAQALVVGAARPEVRIRFDAARLDRYGLTLEQVRGAIADANRFTPAGELRDGWYRYSVQVQSRIGSLDDIRDIPLLRAGETLLRVRDLAEVELAEADPTSFALLDGRPILSILVKKDFGGNTVRVVRDVEPVLEEIRAAFPGIRIEVLSESATFIDRIVRNLLQTLALGAILAFFVLFAFLRDPRLPFTIGIAIPVSLGMTFFVMRLADVNLNIISLSGLTLGIGLLVDNAIVVLENINRYRDGRSLTEAAARGTREIALAATASTLTTLSVFAPLLFLSGFEGALFRDQAFTLSVSLLASLLVALFVLPVLVVYAKPKPLTISHSGFDRLTERYEASVQRAIRRPALLIGGCLALMAASTALWIHLPKSLLPLAEPDRLELRVSLPTNTALESTRYAAMRMNEAVARPGTVILGGYTDRTNMDRIADEAMSVFRMDIPLQGPGDAARVMDAIEEVRRGHPDWRIEPVGGDDLFAGLLGATEPPLLLRVVGQDRARSEAVAGDLAAALPGLAERFPERRDVYRIRLNPDALLRYGVSEQAVIRHLESRAQGNRITEWQRDDEAVALRLLTGASAAFDPADIRIPVAGRRIPLADLADIRIEPEPAQLERTGQAPVLSYVVPFGIAEAWSQLGRVRGLATEISVKTGTQVRVAGSVLRVETLLNDMSVLIGISLILMYLILAIQYESLGMPLMVLLSVPFAWVGALAFLWIGGAGLNVMSFMGILILTGIAVNDAILKVDFLRRYLADTGDLEQAIRMASRHRFRPVVMTSATTILGLIPMVLPIGEGVETRAALGLALIGGLITSTVLTLYVIPALFRALNRKMLKVEG
jgi:HAE1 family hydrophobic/amphiphilic exporter-1